MEHPVAIVTGGSRGIVRAIALELAAMGYNIVMSHFDFDEAAFSKAVNGLNPSGKIFPVSAKTGEGTEDLVKYVKQAMPESPYLFGEDEVSDVPEAMWVAELVREQLVRKTKQELPHSIHCRVTEFEWPHILVEILVERESQKAIVVGRHGSMIRDVGTAGRQEIAKFLGRPVHLRLNVRVEEDWTHSRSEIARLGYEDGTP